MFSVLSARNSSLANLQQTVLQIERQRVTAPPEDLNIKRLAIYMQMK